MNEADLISVICRCGLEHVMEPVVYTSSER